jgi:flagellar protein FliS
MQNGISLSYGKQPMIKYKEQEVLSASPERLVLHLYDHVISCCSNNNSDGACRALVELIDSLNFDYSEISSGLLRLYEYCLKQLKVNKFDETLAIMKELRQTWAQATTVKHDEKHNASGSVQGVFA